MNIEKIVAWIEAGPDSQIMWVDNDWRNVRRGDVQVDFAKVRRRIEDLRTALSGLLDGIDALHDPDRCGLDHIQWVTRIRHARELLEDK